MAQSHPQKGDRLLDVGCGVGGFLTICREAGLDVSQQAVDLARDILPDVPIHCGTLAEAPWPALTFTAITIWEVIEHVEDPLATICAAEKLLKTGGVLAISTPDWGSRYVRCHPSPTWWPPFHIWFFREKSLRALLTMSEMQVTSVRRMPVPWGVTKWPRRKRILALPWLAWCGIVRREGGGRLWATAKKI
ncbi:MAG: class I SAM-dependent methyltransferase [Planctomycetia bacterium]|nr:class I SAM-dependent methyltransferase [Planctomycetia bacterium]